MKILELKKRNSILRPCDRMIRRSYRQLHKHRYSLLHLQHTVCGVMNGFTLKKHAPDAIGKMSAGNSTICDFTVGGGSYLNIRYGCSLQQLQISMFVKLNTNCKHWKRLVKVFFHGKTKTFRIGH